MNGNRTRKEHLQAGGVDWVETYCYNERNQLTERRNREGVSRYLYDPEGNLLREKNGEKESVYRYDLLNRQTYLRTMEGREQENRYDGEGLRAGTVENGKVYTFLYHDGELLAECDGEGAAISRHVRGHGLSHIQTMGDSRYHACHRDEQGSTAYLTGEDGSVENSYLYDAFGNELESLEGIQNRIRYTGQQYDPETGQYYLRARYYNPLIGRFTQEDTYRGDGLNLYAYCGNNPVVYFDPSGYQGCNQSGSEKLEDTPTNHVGGKKPNGYSVGDIDEHGLLSSGKNRAVGNHNNASEGRVQSHHIIQDKWARENISGYKRNDAPAILLETGKGKPHTSITNSQRARNKKVGYNTSIQDEFNNSFSDLINAGVDKKTAQKAIKEAYKYFEGLGAFNL